MKRTEAIAKLLQVFTREDLASMYHAGMECQVNVQRGNGERIEKDFKGMTWQGWTDGIQEWKSFRIPYNAMSKPEYTDSDMQFDLAQHAAGIGMTGWNWVELKSYWVAYDFDAIIGHSEKHTKKLSSEELDRIRELVSDIPWVTVRYSTSGSGLHLYVLLDGVPTANHNEHAALARAILAKLSALVGYDFSKRVDVCGGNMWVWHRKMSKAPDIALKLIKPGVVLTDIPVNWTDHIGVTSGRAKRAVPKFVIDTGTEDEFEELTAGRARTVLDDKHRKLLNWLEDKDCLWSWNQDSGMLITHTCDLLDAHTSLSLRGLFKTSSPGSNRENEWNCYALPLLDGAWVVRRFTKGADEHPIWEEDQNGWTRAFYNVLPSLEMVARYFEGVEDENGGYVFSNRTEAIDVCKQLGVALDVPAELEHREFCIIEHKDSSKIKVEFKYQDTDRPMKGWLKKRSKWVRILTVNEPSNVESELINYDDVIRHLVTENGLDYITGWGLLSDGSWRLKKRADIDMYLRGYDSRKQLEVQKVLGSCIRGPWTIVCKPFQPEFLGDRNWNRRAAQLAYEPSSNHNQLNYPTWLKMLQHVGSNLDHAVAANSWCRDNNIMNGADYLKCWIASLFQEPDQPLPYLFLYSYTQGTGKSVFHESINLLLSRGCCRAESALISKQHFNGEMEGAVLCVIEETDLRSNRSAAERIKDWVTSPTIQIHHKGMTPYTMQNTWHFIQCSNDLGFCPIFETDTRITAIEVKPLESPIPKRALFEQLRAEAQDFLGEVVNLELPKPLDRLNIPTLDTEIKRDAIESSQSSLQAFIDQSLHIRPGHVLLFSTFYDEFMQFLPKAERPKWSKIRVGKTLPPNTPRGRLPNGKHYVGNITMVKDAEDLEEYFRVDDTLKRKSEMK